MGHDKSECPYCSGRITGVCPYNIKNIDLAILLGNTFNAFEKQDRQEAAPPKNDVEYLKHENVYYLPDSKQAKLYRKYLSVKIQVSLDPNNPYPYPQNFQLTSKDRTIDEFLVTSLGIRDARIGGLSSFNDMMNYIKQNTGRTTV
jgi:hypothetical protein